MIYNEEKSHTNFFSEEDGEKIVAAIASVEEKTSGEIRVHLEDFCSEDAFKRAQQVFQKLKMTETQDRNGLLIYLAIRDHKFSLVCDKGLMKHVSNEFWSQISDQMSAEFGKGLYLHAILFAIENAGKVLNQYFPTSDSGPNELTNTISYGENLQ